MAHTYNTTSAGIFHNFAPDYLTAAFVGLMAGLLGAGVYLAPNYATYLLAAIGIGLPILLLIWSHPEFGLLGLLFATSSFIPVQTVDLRLPVGGLDLRDLTLIMVAAVVALRAVLRPRQTRLWSPVGIALLFWLGVAFFSAIYALFYREVEAHWVLSELRPLIYYGTFFLTIFAIVQKRQLKILLAGLYVLADLTAAVLVVQQFFGKDNRLLSAMTLGAYNGWNVWSAADPSVGFGAVRIIPPGHVLTYVVTIITFCLLMREFTPGLRTFLLLQFAYLNFALVLTYSRAQWVASAIALIVTVLLLPKTDKIKLARLGVVTVLALMLGYGLFGSEVELIFKNRPFLTTVAARASSLLNPDQTIESDSLQWRLFETDQALKSISRYPLLGVGLGGVYRAPTLLQGEALYGYRSGLRLTRFVHNSYLYIAVKMGLLGLLAIGAFLLAVLLTAWQTYRKSFDRSLKLVTLAMFASLFGLLAWAVTQSQLLQPESTSVIGLVAGVVVSIGVLERTGKTPLSKDKLTARPTNES